MMTGRDISTLECSCLHWYEASKQCRVQGRRYWWDEKIHPSSYSDVTKYQGLQVELIRVT